MKKFGKLSAAILALAALFILAAINRADAASPEPNTKDEYVKQAEAGLTELKGKIKSAEATVAKAQKKGSEAVDAKIKALKSMIEKTEKDLGQLKKAGQSDWSLFRAQVDGDLGKAERAYKELITSSELFLQEQKDEYLKDMDRMLNAYDKKISNLEARIAKATAEQKKELDADLADLKAKREKVQKQLDGIKAAGLDKWKEMKAAFEKERKEMNDSYRKLAAKIK